MKVLSLFDGMACGMIAMLNSGVQVDEYIAYEIDKYAIQTATHNFPMIKECGDVFKADFTQYKGFDYLIGGSPCTYWSIAQKNNRETEASGMGWELFSQYVRALHEAQPMFFIYENNKSMSKEIRRSISEAFGFEPVCINSALVSAQNRQRLYWVGKRTEDGTYTNVPVEQPEDRGILLKDILQTDSYRDKATCLAANRGGHSLTNDLKDSRYTYACERILAYSTEKSRPLEATYQKAGCGESSLKQRMFSQNPRRQQVDLIAEPLVEKAYTLDASYWKTTGQYNPQNQCSRRLMVEEVVNKSSVGLNTNPSGKGMNGDVIGVDWKSRTLTTNKGDGQKIICQLHFAQPTEWDVDGYPTKAKSAVDGKEHPVYLAQDGRITIKGKTYPIKLHDGYYIIRKLTVTECKRLQTVPEWYEFPVSNSQAYKQLGNGWTCDVITHLIKATMGVKI